MPIVARPAPQDHLAIRRHGDDKLRADSLRCVAFGSSALLTTTAITYADFVALGQIIVAVTLSLARTNSANWL